MLLMKTRPAVTDSDVMLNMSMNLSPSSVSSSLSGAMTDISLLCARAATELSIATAAGMYHM